MRVSTRGTRDFQEVTDWGVALQVCELGEDSFNKKFSIKRCKVIDTLTEAYKFDRDSQFALNCDDDSTSCAAVEFRQDDAGESYRFAKDFGLSKAVLAGGSVKHQENFIDLRALLDYSAHFS